ncbi:tRNA lysidine(34) synthetase TilS [Clostridium tarantellae]|uniref:tRNA(Ile)-lysidine synthase n=1 Tax=Clostridium tarantellae TaxID=39493 RepID=A0A6I1MMK0_9CLOT|nr:tRNA lysidine(34) synthetase TilS [Clostridium tarantellae]MPQ42161.1 tRNA lysidine(34) synthetase TilS [Clostridium tarantellae]
MINKVKNFIRDNSMMDKGDKVLIALSGGPDSVCLLYILHKLKDDLQIKLHAAHVNHCLRGENALKDEEYCKEICKYLDIPISIKRVDINNISKEKSISTEMAGREERYSFFNEVKKQFNISKIAIAHNSNDQAETVIMRAVRGSGIEGLTGIKPIRDNLYIRPILCLTRKEIENYCANENLKARIDETNLEEIYSRNKIRLKAIPFLEENFNANLISTLNRLAYSCSKDVEFIEEVVTERYKKYCENFSDSIVIKEDAFNEKEAILTRIIKKSLMNISKKFNNFEMKHIYDIITLQKGETGKNIHITNGVIAKNEYGKIKLILKENLNKDLKKDKIELGNLHIELKENKIINIYDDYFGKFEFSLTNNKINFNDEFTKYFDYDKISNISIRNRRDGDRIVPLGMKCSKKLKDIFMDCKIPKDKRSEIPLLIFNDKIAWVVGVKVSDEFKINKKTKNILKVKFEREE